MVIFIARYIESFTITSSLVGIETLRRMYRSLSKNFFSASRYVPNWIRYLYLRPLYILNYHLCIPKYNRIVSIPSLAQLKNRKYDFVNTYTLDSWETIITKKLTFDWKDHQCLSEDIRIGRFCRIFRMWKFQDRWNHSAKEEEKH